MHHLMQMEEEAMQGMPDYLFLCSLAAIGLLSGIILIIFIKGRTTTENYPKYDLLNITLIKSLANKRPFQTMIQLPGVFLFLLIIYAGLYGTSYPARNIAPILTWTIWWTGIIIAIVFMGKLWCLMCPWDAIASWLQRLGLWKVKKDIFSLNLPWPKRLRNIYLAIGLFILLTWLELGYGVTFSPKATAYLGIVMLSITILPAIIFERKSFCRYACLVGRISGLYAMFASSELRARDKNICAACKTKDCLKGNDSGYGCPTFEYLGNMVTNTYCILCAECIKTCPRDNVSFNLRPFATDLAKAVQPKTDEAILSLVMLSLTLFHGLTMTPYWRTISTKLGSQLNLGYLPSFTLAMAAIIIIPGLIYFLFSWIIKGSLRQEDIPLKKVFINFTYPILPLALFYHLAHNSQHLLQEGQKLIPLISDPFGWQWDLLGTAAWSPKPLISLSVIWYIQSLLLVIGYGYAAYIAGIMSQQSFADQRRAFRSHILLLIFLFLCAFVSLWLMRQPMEMRTAM